MAPLLMLVLVALLACAAHAQVSMFDFVVVNNLPTSYRANDALCTISASELGGPVSRFVPAGQSVTFPLSAAQPLTSPSFTVEVYGQGPLGQGCYGCCFVFFGCGPGKRYTVSGQPLMKLASLVGYTIRLAGNCGTPQVPQLLLEGFVTSAGSTVVQSTCVPQDP